MTKQPKKQWIKPELTSITIHGVGGDLPFCTTGLTRGVACGENNVPTSAVACHPNKKNTVFS